MNPGEHETMARVEERHWWYRGLRDALVRALERSDPPLPARPRVLDAGCGTGANLERLAVTLHPSYLGGFDLSEEAVRLARAKAPGADIREGDICEPPEQGMPLDLVVSMDVVCIPGVERARPGLAALVSRLRPGGLVVVNLPAYRWLRSEHDVAVHTTERYTARELRALLESLGLRVELLTYRLFALFPLLVLARLPRMIKRAPAGRPARSDLHQEPSDLANRALFAILRLENTLIAAGVRLPWGSSVFAVARKPQ